MYRERVFVVILIVLMIQKFEYCPVANLICVPPLVGNLSLMSFGMAGVGSVPGVNATAAATSAPQQLMAALGAQALGSQASIFMIKPCVPRNNMQNSAAVLYTLPSHLVLVWAFAGCTEGLY